MPETYVTDKYRLDTLLKQIHDGDLALPDFQRDFVWDPDATEELLESIVRDFPTGSLLFMRHRDDGFTPRAFEGAPRLGRRPLRLVLDGQQRLTSLYQALYGAGEYSYYLHLERLEEGQPVEDALIHESNKRAAKLGYDDIAYQAAHLLMPLRALFGGSDRFQGWSRAVRRAKTASGAKADTTEQLEERLSRFHQKHLASIDAYTYPYVELDDRVSMEAICKIFETLNRTGVKLTVFELLGARYFAANLKLRDLWQKALDEFPILGKDGFEIDPTMLLQVVSLRAAPDPSRAACQKTDLLQLSADDIRANWDDAVAGLCGVLRMLQDDCGVLVKRWVPYSTQLIPMAAAWPAVTAPKGAAVGANKAKLQVWFWRAIFRRDYESAANTQAAVDFRALMEWFRGGPPPGALAATPMLPDFASVTPSQRALYNAAIALVVRNGATDFHKGNRLTPQVIADAQIDDHHVFPRGHLGNQFPTEMVNSVANRTLIDRITNIRIGKRAPSAYLADMAKELTPKALEQILESHLLPAGEESSLRLDQFALFLAERKTALNQAALQAMGSNVRTEAVSAMSDYPLSDSPVAQPVAAPAAKVAQGIQTAAGSRGALEYSRLLTSSSAATREVDRLLRAWAAENALTVEPSQSGKMMVLSMAGARNVARLSLRSERLRLSIQALVLAGRDSEANDLRQRIKEVFGLTKIAPLNPRIPTEKVVSEWDRWIRELANDYLQARRAVVGRDHEQTGVDDEDEGD